MRTIDADALTESIKECIEAKDANCEWEQVQGLECALECIDEEPTVQPVQWIPWDSGRFPNDSGTYIVTAYDGVKERVTFAKYQKRLKRWELTGARAYWRVLAWMPLPEISGQAERSR